MMMDRTGLYQEKGDSDMNARSFYRLVCLITGFVLMSAWGVAYGGSYDSALIVYGGGAASGEVHAARELATDLAKVYGFSAEVVSADEFQEGSRPQEAALFYVGTVDTHSLIRRLSEQGKIEVSSAEPGPEAFVIKSFPEDGLVVIAGCDERGTLYGAYGFSERFLGIDPLAYWTGKEPEQRDSLTIEPIHVRREPPAFKLRGYFDNDSDMLANYKGRKLVIEFDTWKEMIDSLARLGYNFIDPFDTMGRTEFWVWPYYKENFPGYHTDLELLNKIMDYAHKKGMLVQVSTYLGYEFHHLPYEKKCLSIYHDDWIEAYRYLLEETPAGKADIFYHSPRDPWWDWPYICAYETLLGIDKGRLHSRLINDLYKLVKEHNPDARLMGLFWSDGKEFWEKGTYRPRKDIDMVWSDDGYGRYPSWPEERRGHDFGIYIHAGYWKNHVMQDPYPARIKKSVLEAYQRGLNEYIFVNGQDFKHFILNLEACARAAWDPEAFEPQSYYQQWTGRYFGKDAAPLTVKSLKALHRAHDLAGGFADLTMKTKIYIELVRYYAPYCRDYSYLDPALNEAERSLSLARQARKLVPKESKKVFDDQVLFPARIYLKNLELHAGVAGTIRARCTLLDPFAGLSEKQEAIDDLKRYRKEAPEDLAELLRLLRQGSGWEKWEGWTRPENFRKYEPPPEIETVESAL
ncbi:MAG: glycosyl hydrolase 115 family protein [bacterium]